jgi:hypothetical protein
MTPDLSLGTLLRLARDTITDPREGATTVLSFAPPRQALWLMFAIVVVLSLFMGELVFLISPVPDGALSGPYQSSPILLGLLQAAFLFVMVHAITFIGRWFGGTGRFEEALLLMVWLQFIFLCVQVIQLIALVIIPPMAAVITLLALGLFLWLLVNFIAVLHGFTSLGMVLVMTILSALAILFAMSLVLSILGLTSMTGAV